MTPFPLTSERELRGICKFWEISRRFATNHVHTIADAQKVWRQGPRVSAKAEGFGTMFRDGRKDQPGRIRQELQEQWADYVG